MNFKILCLLILNLVKDLKS